MSKALPRKRLTALPVYKEYCLRYRYQFLRFVVEASAKYPTWQQRDLMNAMSVPNFRVSCVSGHGCHEKGHGIRMCDGSVKRVEDVIVGDQLMGDDGTPRNVLMLNRGREDMRRVIPEKGKPFVVNNSHLLSLKYLPKSEKGEKESYLPKPIDVSVEEFLNIPDWDRERFVLWKSDNEAFAGIKAIERLGEDEYFGFEIDGNHLYQDEDGIIHHNTGKSFTYAWFIIWHVTVFPFSNLILTGPKFEQLRKIIWKELADALEVFHRAYPWIKGYFVKDAKSFYALGFKDNWFAIPQTAPRKEPEKLAGQHRDKYTVLVEEASGLPDEHFDVIKGALTGKDNSLAMISQGTRPNGVFYDSHHSKKELCHTLQFDSELSPIVKKRWIRERLVEYGGFFSTLYQIRVKGAFPNQLEGRLISRSWAEACGDIEIEHKQIPGILITVDVSGEGHDETVYLVSKVSGWESKRKLETVELIIKQGESKVPDVAREVKALFGRYEAMGAQIGVDHIGVGKGVYDLLEEWALPVYRMNVGKAAHDDETYRNQRAEWSYWLRDAVFNCNVSFKGIQHSNQQKIYDQFGNIPYRITEEGKLKLWSKDQMANDGIKSPDIFDVYMFAMGMDYIAMDVQSETDAHFTVARAKANAAMDKINQLRDQAGV